ncbi:heavy metal-associated isoprenylated plant protein 35-like isoform X2 [Musa acuminata AAA Group]|uniref:heavy metal-associated isoprenylated plant protein 35-like isoform X2 n=1 Tax=Musa acuminata AAA Group TaxID=214697 RepID=UPI0031DC276C
MTSEGEAIKNKVSVLKVSIHCEGCKKKVYKILSKIKGVDEVEIDARQNMVTVKAPLDPQALIAKLKKSGKHAELWLDKKPSHQFFHHGKNDVSLKDESKESSKSTAPSPAAAKRGDADKPVADNRSVSETKETKAETADNTSKKVAKAGEKTAEISKPPAETTVDSAKKAPASKEATNNGGHSGGGGGEKRAEKNSNVRLGIDDSDVRGVSNSHPAFPPQPAYIMSYNTAQPSISQSYYVSPMQPASQGYMYSYPPPPEYFYSNLDANSSAPVQHPDPYNSIFSDENPNSCSIM